MAAVICRLVAHPVTKTQYLATLEPAVWTDDKDQAHVFPTHSIADELARNLRTVLAQAVGQTGERLYFFVHARALESYELPAKNERAVFLDPFRAAQVRRDPVD